MRRRGNIGFKNELALVKETKYVNEKLDMTNLPEPEVFDVIFDRWADESLRAVPFIDS